MSLDHDSATPLYAQLAAIIRGQIERGELTGRLPSVKTLTQEYGIAQGTAERAFAMLRAEGLIRSTMGRGHFVVPAAERRLASIPGAVIELSSGRQPGSAGKGDLGRRQRISSGPPSGPQSADMPNRPSVARNPRS